MDYARKLANPPYNLRSHSIKKNILLGVTGSIAAYKSAELIRLLRKADFEVRVVMSNSASAFITPLTLQTLSNNPVLENHFSVEKEASISHIELARAADLILIAPATAHVMAKLAVGLADDLLSTIILASRAPLWLAPAMNRVMWEQSVTQNNVSLLRERGVRFIGPSEGAQACGDIGEGRMEAPENILQAIQHFFTSGAMLAGVRVLITAGPTRENLDPVRYLSNYSSGKMGYAIAEAAAKAGAQVILISGPTSLTTPAGVQRLDILSAHELFTAVQVQIVSCDIFISAAAVSDYRAKEIRAHKIKKSEAEIALQFIKNVDILSWVSNSIYRPTLVVGFAAETENLIENATLKLHQKKADLIVANAVNDGNGFDKDDNELFVLGFNFFKKLPRASKKQLAEQLVELLALTLMPSTVVPWFIHGIQKNLSRGLSTGSRKIFKKQLDPADKPRDDEFGMPRLVKKAE